VAAVRAGTNEHADGHDVAVELEGKVDLVLDAGGPRFSKPSTIVRVRKDSYEIVRPGIYDQRIIERLLRTTILYVCSGNTCRSPMAEAITRQILSRQLHVSEDDLEKIASFDGCEAMVKRVRQDVYENGNLTPYFADKYQLFLELGLL